MPDNLAHAQERVKDIQFASKQRFNNDRMQQIETMRAALKRVLGKLPKKMLQDADVKALQAMSTRGRCSLVHVVNRHAVRASQYKDCEFSRATVSELWGFGAEDVHRAVTDPSALRTIELSEQVHIYEFTGSEDKAR